MARIVQKSGAISQFRLKLWRPIHNLFTGCISMHGRCHDLPWLNEFSGVVLTSFMLSRQTSWTEVLLSWRGRLAQTIVRGNCLFKVTGQEKCEYTMTMFSKCFKFWILKGSNLCYWRSLEIWTSIVITSLLSLCQFPNTISKTWIIWIGQQTNS